MLNDLWILLSSIIIFIGLVASEGLLLVVGSLVIVLAIAARVWDRYAFRAVTHTRFINRQRAFIGDTVEYTVSLDNDKVLPLIWVDIHDSFPDGLNLTGATMRGTLAIMSSDSAHRKNARGQQHDPCRATLSMARNYL